MKQSSVLLPVESVDVAANARASLARARLGASDLVERFGGSHAYWSRRLTGVQPMSVADMSAIAELIGVHPAELVGGQPPTGWDLSVTRRLSTVRTPTAPIATIDYLSQSSYTLTA